MNESEYKVADGAGEFLQAVKGGRRLQDAEWTTGRILLSNRRVVLASNDGTRTLPLSAVTDLSGRYDVNQTVAEVSDYVTVELREDDVVLVSMDEDTEGFEAELYRVLLDQTELLVKHPAVRGGVVQDESFERARITVDDEEVGVAMQNGSFVAVELGDVGSVETTTLDVQGEQQPVVDVEHTVGDASVRTYFSSDSRTCSLLESLLEGQPRQGQGSVDLSETEKRVLVALYSGVSPFEIPEFLGMDVDEVEAIFERLIDANVLEEVRKRREVSLQPRGRNIASQAINEE